MAAFEGTEKVQRRRTPGEKGPREGASEKEGGAAQHGVSLQAFPVLRLGNGAAATGFGALEGGATSTSRDGRAVRSRVDVVCL